MKALQERDKELQEVYNQLFKSAQNQVIQDLQSYHDSYGGVMGLAPEQAKLRVSEYDVQTFADRARKYVQSRDFSDKANRELKMYNYALRANRAELLKANLHLTMLELEDDERTLTQREILREGLAEYERQAGIMHMSVPEPEVMRQTIETLSQTSYKGATWSDRIWKRQEGLRGIVQNLAETVTVQGKNPLEFVPELRQAFGVGAYEARRLAVTESCRVQVGVQKNVMLDNGFEYYVWVTEPTACPYCKSMEGKSFNTADMQPGLNAPPGHPHCHCTTAPDADKERDMLEEMFREYEETKNEGLQLRSNKRISYSAPSERFSRLISGSVTSLQASPVRGVENDIYVSSKLRHRKKAARFYDQQFSQAFERLGDLGEGLNRPKIVIVDKTETKSHVIASFNPRENTLFVRGDIRSSEAMKSAQEGSLAMNGNPLSTVIHELGHWYQYQAIKQKYPQLTYTEIMGKELHNSKKMVEKMMDDGYNLSRDVSEYATLNNLKQKHFEVFAELMVHHLLGSRDFSEYIEKGVE